MLHSLVEGCNIFLIILYIFDYVKSLGVISCTYGTMCGGDCVGGGMTYYGEEEQCYCGELKDHVLCVVALESSAVAVR